MCEGGLEGGFVGGKEGGREGGMERGFAVGGREGETKRDWEGGLWVKGCRVLGLDIVGLWERDGQQEGPKFVWLRRWEKETRVT